MRALATIRTISNLEPIEGADNILVASVDGWQLVVKKEEFQVGDLCVYFEIDSFIPVMGAIMHLENKFTTYNGEAGLRVKTIRLRGQVSQGIALPLNVFQDVFTWGNVANRVTPIWMLHDSTYLEPGVDVTEHLGVKLWERPIPSEMQGVMRGNFPSFIPKTDQDRVQNIGKTLPRLYGKRFEITQKLDGASMTIYCVNEEMDCGILGINDAPRVGVCSRIIDFEMDTDNIYTRTAKNEGWLDALRAFPGIAVQGELVGPSIAENREHATETTFNVFDVYDIDAARFFTPQERYDFLQELVNFGVNARHVPVLAMEFIMTEENCYPDYFVEFANAYCGSNKEGLVYKQMDGEFSFKAVSNAYLLKHGD
jgi:RNA ligase (TIGR02306 family)